MEPSLSAAVHQGLQIACCTSLPALALLAAVGLLGLLLRRTCWPMLTGGVVAWCLVVPGVTMLAVANSDQRPMTADAVRVMALTAGFLATLAGIALGAVLAIDRAMTAPQPEQGVQF
jgi:uncharacterized oligopeptide transporter (OPT) family protein